MHFKCFKKALQKPPSLIIKGCNAEANLISGLSGLKFKGLDKFQSMIDYTSLETYFISCKSFNWIAYELQELPAIIQRFLKMNPTWNAQNNLRDDTKNRLLFLVTGIYVLRYLFFKEHRFWDISSVTFHWFPCIPGMLTYTCYQIKKTIVLKKPETW